MIIGYPVTDREVDMIFESESAREWERLNSFGLAKKDFDTLNDASASLSIVERDFRSITKYMGEAIEALHDTPECDRLESLMESLDTIYYETMEIKDRIRREMRSK